MCRKGMQLDPLTRVHPNLWYQDFFNNSSVCMRVQLIMVVSVNGRDKNQGAHANNPYVVSVRCSRFKERKNCTRERELEQA